MGIIILIMRNTIDQSYYEVEKGSSWPSWQDFLAGAYTDDDIINKELDTFTSRYAYTLTLEEKDFNVDNHIFQLFPPLLYRFTYPFDWDTLEPLVNAKINSCVANSPNIDGDMISMAFDHSGTYPHTWPEFQGFVRFIDQAIEQIKRRNLITGSEHRIASSWLNKAVEGGWSTEHNHVPSTFSVVSYLRATPGAGKLVFRDPLEYHKGNYPLPSYYPETLLRREVDVKTNDVIIFPGFMYHNTTPHPKKDDDRISFALNINCQFPTPDTYYLHEEA